MPDKFVDLHIHSFYSDGTMSPKEILEEAIKNNVGVMAITDHDVLEGSIELLTLSKDYDIECISGVELDAIDNGRNIHILGYGMNMMDEAFRSFVKSNRALLDLVNYKLIEKMQVDYDFITTEDYSEYNYDHRKGGWKALHYLMDKGLTKELREGFSFYIKYECDYDIVNFPSVQEVCKNIHNAGGKAILAHPGVTFHEYDTSELSKLIIQYLDYGFDGIECYYPKHSDELTQACLNICKERNLLITTGSDCHGGFGNADIGEMKISHSSVLLGDLI